MATLFDLLRRARRKIAKIFSGAGAPTRVIPPQFLQSIKEVRKPRTACGRALMAYVCDPFSIAKDSSESRRHANVIQCLVVADELAARGYIVDVTHWRNPSPPDGSDYDVIFGLGPAFSMAAAKRNDDSIAVYFGTGTVANQTNLMQIRRDREFGKRHGVDIRSSLHDEDIGPSLADHLLITGDDWVIGTYSGYSSANVSICPNPIVSGVVDTRESKDFQSSRSHFIWMAAYGGLRRRLDHVLEAFSRTPELQLWVCGDLRHEKAFYPVIKPLLDGLDNVHEMGWIDVGSIEYQEITARCGYMIYPSCSDGFPGSVVNAMASGVVPLVTRETGIDVQECGFKFVMDSSEEIESVLRQSAQIDPQVLAQLSGNSVRTATVGFSQDRFRECVHDCFDRAGLHPVLS